VSAFLGMDLGRISSAPAFRNSEVQLVVANLFNQRPSQVVDAVLGYDPYNNPTTPRSIGVMLSKRFE
jgi:iron complex outermembrane receptor protein